MQLPNRQQLEAEAAARLTQLATRQRRRLEELIVLLPVRQSASVVDPANPGNIFARPIVDFSRVPAPVWDMTRQEAEDDMLTILLLLFLASAEYHAIAAGAAADSRGRILDDSLRRQLQNAAEDYARRRAPIAAQQWASTAQKQFDAARRKIETAADQARLDDASRAAAAAVDDANRAANVPSIFRPAARRDAQRERIDAEQSALRERAIELQKALEEIAKQLAQELAKTLGPDRAASYAINETTAAQSAGGDAGVQATIGISLDDLWINRPDKSSSGPCPVCKPLHLVPRRDWPVDYFDGPGPWVHVNCVCVVQYANMRRKPATIPPSEPPNDGGDGGGDGGGGGPSPSPAPKPRNYFETIGGRIVVARTGKEL
jgi:hypothetical protein